MKFRFCHKLASWVAITAILLASFAPAISHALERKSVSLEAIQQICSANGIKNLPSGDSSPAKHLPSHNLEHCPFCSLHADDVALANIPDLVWLVDFKPLHYAGHYQAPQLQLSLFSLYLSQAPPAFITV